jgi:hypothetical protein
MAGGRRRPARPGPSGAGLSDSLPSAHPRLPGPAALRGPARRGSIVARPAPAAPRDARQARPRSGSKARSDACCTWFRNPGTRPPRPTPGWGRVLHDSDLAQAILDRVLERGRHLELRGPSYRTRHLKLDQHLPAEAHSGHPARSSGRHNHPHGHPCLPERRYVRCCRTGTTPWELMAGEQLTVK